MCTMLLRSSALLLVSRGLVRLCLSLPAPP
jgi:hypothetical protein